MSTKPHTDRDFSLDHVPAGQRRGFWPMLAVMLGFTFFSASMWAGGRLGAGLTLRDFLIAMIGGNLILGVYTSLLAFMAARTGLSTHLLARYSFGVKGSFLPSLILSVTQIGWFGVGVAMFAIPVHEATGWNLWLLVLVSGVLMTSSAYWGIRALTVVSVIAVPAIAVFGCYSAGRALFAEGGWAKIVEYAPAEPMPLALALAVSVGTFISGGSCTADFVRFSKSTRIAVITTAVAFFLGNSLMFVFGAAGAMVYQQPDIALVLKMQGLLVPAIIVLGMNIWTTNDNAIYTSGLGMSNITGFPKKYLVLVNGIIGTLLALWLYNNFVSWLNFLNTIIPPVGAILAADYFLVRRGRYPALAEARFKVVNIPAVVAWAAGSAVAFVPWGISAVNGMAVAAVCYTLLNAEQLASCFRRELSEEEGGL